MICFLDIKGLNYMCGIIGYIGKNNAKNQIIDGLKSLRNRGEDSTGLALLHNDTFEIYKELGKIENLESKLSISYISNIGIGHTRLATNGKVTLNNAHPHISNSKRFIIVHNGVIKNANELKNKYLSNYNFYSETDTEVIVNLIDLFSKSLSVIESIEKTISLLEGTYALLILDQEDINKIYVIKNKTPMLIGKSNDEIIISSEVKALIGKSDEYIELSDGAYGVISGKNIMLFNNETVFEGLNANNINSLLLKSTILF